MPGNLNRLGILRLLLAVCVLCAHSSPIAGLGWLDGPTAVEAFFCISGFYMQLVLSTKYTESKLGKTWIQQFYKARYFRLLPTYLFASLITALFSSLFWPTGELISAWRYVCALPGTVGNFLFISFFCLTNVTILGQDVMMFVAVHSGQIHWSANFWKSAFPLWQALTLPQAWSLGLELNCYILAPYLLKERSRPLLVGACCCLAVKLALFGVWHVHDPWTRRFFPLELGYFILGALAFRYRHVLGNLVPDRIASFVVYPFVIAFACAGAGRLHNLYPVVLSGFLPLLFRTTSTVRWDRWIGELSYPFYIFHYFLVAFSRLVVVPKIHAPETSVVWIALVLTLIASVFSMTLESHFIEPWRARFASPSK